MDRRHVLQKRLGFSVSHPIQARENPRQSPIASICLIAITNPRSGNGLGNAFPGFRIAALGDDAAQAAHGCLDESVRNRTKPEHEPVRRLLPERETGKRRDRKPLFRSCRGYILSYDIVRKTDREMKAAMWFGYDRIRQKLSARFHEKLE